MHEQGVATSTRHSDIGRTPFKKIGCKRGAFGISGVPATATSDQVRISRVGILPSTNDDEGFLSPPRYLDQRRVARGAKGRSRERKIEKRKTKTLKKKPTLPLH